MSILDPEECDSEDFDQNGNGCVGFDCSVLNEKRLNRSSYDIKADITADADSDADNLRCVDADQEKMQQQTNANSKAIDEALDKWKNMKPIPKTFENNIVKEQRCPGCGGKIRKLERYCGICGFDTLTIIDPPLKRYSSSPDSREMVTKRIPDKLRIVALLFLCLFGVAGIYWWANDREPVTDITKRNQSAIKQAGAVSNRAPALTKAASYLPEPGIDALFYLSYPSGDAGTMERITARVVPDASTVTELELMEYENKKYGYAYHLFNHADGVYLVYDQAPDDYIPILKENLRSGLSWTYKDEDVETVWTVLGLGEKIDLGFISLENCLVVQEKSDAVDYLKRIYYAPGIGRVMEKTDKGECLMIMTSLGNIDPKQGAEKVKKWAPNYKEIKPLDEP